MKTTINLDYQAILANTAQPVHFALLFETPESTLERPRPVAFTLVLDRSGSMMGEPLEAAKAAARGVIRNLRRDDLFSAVAFDTEARTILPLATVRDKEAAIKVIDGIRTGGCTNLTAGWMLGRDELKKAPAGTLRRLLLLSDGLLNQGITGPDQVTSIVGNGLEVERIRTSCLGFGDGYDEDLMARLAAVTNGHFYDANAAEKLPAIFEAELDGLQQTVVMNLRVRMKRLDFVDGMHYLGGTEPLLLPDGRQEFALGDLMADETLAAVFRIDVLAIPELAPGRPAATLDGEALLEAEILYDEIVDGGIKSVTGMRTVRVRPTQDAADLKVNETALSWITPSLAARIVAEAMTKRDAGQVDEARRILEKGITRMEAYGRPEETGDALRLLRRTLEQIGDDNTFFESRKSMLYSGRAFMIPRTRAHWSGLAEEAPSFSKRPPRRSPKPGSTNEPKQPADGK